MLKYRLNNIQPKYDDLKEIIPQLLHHSQNDIYLNEDLQFYVFIIEKIVHIVIRVHHKFLLFLSTSLIIVTQQVLSSLLTK